MTGKKGKPASVIEPAESPQEFASELPIDVRAFVQDSGLNETGFTVYIYKIPSRQGQGQRQKCFVDQFDNELPSFKDLGMRYGAGHYEIYIRWSDDKGQPQSKKVSINIDESFDRLKAEREAAEKGMQNFSNGSGGGFMQSMMQGVLMVRAITEAISPLVSRSIPTVQSPPPAQSLDTFADTMKSIAAIGSNMLMSNFQSNLEMQKRMFENMTIEIPEPQKDDMLDKMLLMLDKVLPLFKSLPEANAREAAGTFAKESPELSAILKNPARLKVAFSKLVAKHGREGAEKIMRAFGVENDLLAGFAVNGASQDSNSAGGGVETRPKKRKAQRVPLESVQA